MRRSSSVCGSAAVSDAAWLSRRSLLASTNFCRPAHRSTSIRQMWNVSAPPIFHSYVAVILSRFRNDLPMSVTISSLGREGPPSKVSDGRFVFLCPSCGDMLVAVNPRNNLAHCFGCERNFNNIDLLTGAWLRLRRRRRTSRTLVAPPTRRSDPHARQLPRSRLLRRASCGSRLRFAAAVRSRAQTSSRIYESVGNACLCSLTLKVTIRERLR